MYNYDELKNQKAIALWLFICAAAIYCMILLGGITRLTESGLSMVEWRPLIGIIPPLNEADWLTVFSKYQKTPEYLKINHGMSLGEFKNIFMFEYLHRVLGRLIGILFLLPFLFFWITKKIPKGLTPKLLIMFILGGLQGLLGWYMVKSGLVDNPMVSQYRLTAHLSAAVFIYGYILWNAFNLYSASYAPASPKSLRLFSYSLTALIFVMILSGGLVAGTHAGYAYPTWPLMGETFIPSGLYEMTPAWLSIFENITTIQFNHRMFAYLLFVLIISFVFKALLSNLSRQLRAPVIIFILLLFIQVSLGISTLLLHVPVPLAAAHQGGAVALFTIALFISHRLYKSRPAL